MQKVILKAMNDTRRILVVRKIQRTIKDSIWQLTLDLLSGAGIRNLCEVNKSDFEIGLPNGSIFLFKGLDDPEKIKSITGITDIVIEEATELKEDDFTQLDLRLRPEKAKNPQIYLMFNPVSKKNWVYNYFFVNELDEDTKLNKTTYKDNKFLNEDYKKRLESLKNRSPAYYRIYTLGEFATLDKLVFPVYESRIISDKEVEGLPLWIGLDFGYINDPSAIVSGNIDEKNKKIYVKRGMLNDEIAEKMINLGLAKDKSYGDSAEKKSVEEIRRLGVNIEPAEKAPDSVIHGIQWLQQFDLIVDERCFKTIEELENYTWQKDKKTDEYINKPVDAFNHVLDAIRYGLTKYIKGYYTPKIIKKPFGL